MKPAQWFQITGQSCQPRIQSAIVVGAGAVGIATAYALARRGVTMTLIDSGSRVGTGASFANGAQLSYIYTDALANPALLRHIPSVLLGLDPALRYAHGFDIERINWLLRFLRESSAQRATANTIAGLQLGLESRRALHDLLARHPITFDHRQSGKLHIYNSAKGIDAAAKTVALKQRFGALQQVINEAEARRIEPALAARPDRFAGAILSPQEEVGDPFGFCTAMADILVHNYGATLRLGTRIIAIDAKQSRAAVQTDGGEALVADHLVICTGAMASDLLRPMGVRTHLLAMKGYSIDAPAGSAAPTHSITDVARKLVFCQLGSRIRIAGLAELGVWNDRVEPSAIAKLKRVAQASLPQAAEYHSASSGWAGMRPMSPTSLPDSRCVSPTLSINVGHGMLGWTYALGSAERLAEQLLPGVASQ